MMNALALPEATETGTTTTTTTGKETSAAEDPPTLSPSLEEDAPEDGRQGSMFQLIKDFLFEYDPPVANQRTYNHQS
jgi:hypothetical protein